MLHPFPSQAFQIRHDHRLDGFLVRLPSYISTIKGGASAISIAAIDGGDADVDDDDDAAGVHDSGDDDDGVDDDDDDGADDAGYDDGVGGILFAIVITMTSIRLITMRSRMRLMFRMVPPRSRHE
eukprot:7823373-Pyramimonas_sp.AAC.1